MEDQKWRLSPTTLTIFILGLVCILSFSPANTTTAAAGAGSSFSTYIVHVPKPTDKHYAASEDLDALYRSSLPATAASSNQEERMVHSYRHVISGFEAKLTPEEAEAIREKDGVLHVQKEEVLPLHTTHTPDFLGLRQGVGLWKDSNFGKGVIIGVLDTGIFPNHSSFSDEGMPPPPAKWKGRCNFDGTSCNNKVIGARSFVFNGLSPPIDEDGHGTHTASTAAGAFVRDASAFGNAKGTAVGMASLAHLAIYQVCYFLGCLEGAILAGFDTAIKDGVDVLSLSLGEDSQLFFFSCSTGNNGPDTRTLSNEAPWILTKGASTTNRSIKATARLGNRQEFNGETLYQPHDFHPAQLPLVYPGANGDESSALCYPRSLKNRMDIVVRGSGNESDRIRMRNKVKEENQHERFTWFGLSSESMSSGKASK